MFFGKTGSKSHRIPRRLLVALVLIRRLLHHSCARRLFFEVEFHAWRALNFDIDLAIGNAHPRAAV